MCASAQSHLTGALTFCAAPPNHFLAFSNPASLRPSPSINLQNAQMVAKAWFGAATAAHMQKEDWRALPAFERAAELAGEDGALKARALVGIASIAQAFGNEARAVDSLREASQYDPKVSDVAAGGHREAWD